jgi:hypothetical protein
MDFCLFVRREYARCFDHDINVHIFPRQFQRLALAQKANHPAVHRQIPLLYFYRKRTAPVRGVIPQEIRKIFETSEIVDRHNFYILARLGHTEKRPPDSSEPVYRHAYFFHRYSISHSYGMYHTRIPKNG